MLLNEYKNLFIEEEYQNKLELSCFDSIIKGFNNDEYKFNKIYLKYINNSENRDELEEECYNIVIEKNELSAYKHFVELFYNSKYKDDINKQKYKLQISNSFGIGSNLTTLFPNNYSERSFFTSLPGLELNYGNSIKSINLTYNYLRGDIILDQRIENRQYINYIHNLNLNFHINIINLLFFFRQDYSIFDFYIAPGTYAIYQKISSNINNESINKKYLSLGLNFEVGIKLNLDKTVIYFGGVYNYRIYANEINIISVFNYPFQINFGLFFNL